MYLKTHISDGTLLVAVCDRELVGQTFNDGTLSLEVSEFFYKGDLAEPADVRRALEGAVVANLVGERAIAAALEGGFMSESNILTIDGVPHAQMVAVATSATSQSTLLRYRFDRTGSI